MQLCTCRISFIYDYVLAYINDYCTYYICSNISALITEPVKPERLESVCDGKYIIYYILCSVGNYVANTALQGNLCMYNYAYMTEPMKNVLQAQLQESTSTNQK